MPEATPVSTPLVAPIVAMAALALLHVPPLALFVNVDVVPGHALNVPDIVPGLPFTVTTRVASVPQPVE